jgi:hypothetical protein
MWHRGNEQRCPHQPSCHRPRRGLTISVTGDARSERRSRRPHQAARPSCYRALQSQSTTAAARHLLHRCRRRFVTRSGVRPSSTPSAYRRATSLPSSSDPAAQVPSGRDRRPMMAGLLCQGRVTEPVPPTARQYVLGRPRPAGSRAHWPDDQADDESSGEGKAAFRG